MEGLIPYVYRAIVRYNSAGGQPPTPTSWFKESPTTSPFSYVRLPGSDSGRFHPAAPSHETINSAQTFILNRSTTTTSSSAATAPITTQSLLCRTAAASQFCREVLLIHNCIEQTNCPVLMQWITPPLAHR
ncbi:hypothetical protein Sjap_001846 [Stephania japonica]|uniref:Uncharacterized protein n=1 Tax=Stephania japonica TaxID=461633 RepID=A0AAP0KKW8_9MAGN